MLVDNILYIIVYTNHICISPNSIYTTKDYIFDNDLLMFSMLFNLYIITSLSTMQLVIYILLLDITMYNSVGIIDTYIYTYKFLIINTNYFTNRLSSRLLKLPEILSSLLPALYIILLNTFPCLKYNIYIDNISLDIIM